MSESEQKNEPIVFAHRLVSSKAFAALFEEGMTLVEKTATYLDGPGREESKQLKGNDALIYATESMRLTTRLMQAASWLLLTRAFGEKDMSYDNFMREKSRIKQISVPADTAEMAVLPVALQGLITQSVGLAQSVTRMDVRMNSTTQVPVTGTADAVGARGLLQILKGSFE